MKLRTSVLSAVLIAMASSAPLQADGLPPLILISRNDVESFDMDKLAATCTEALKSSPQLTKAEKIECFWKRGLANWYRDRYRDAALDFAAVAALSPEDVDARLMLARSYKGSGSVDKALDELKALSEANPSCSTAFAIMALCKCNTNQLTEAEEFASKAIKLNEKDPLACWAKARVAYEEGGLQDSQHWASRCLELSSSQFPKPYMAVTEAAYALRAIATFSLGDHDQFILDANRVTRDPDFVAALTRLKVYCYVTLGNVDAAREVFSKSKQKSTNGKLPSDVKMLSCLLNGKRAEAAKIAEELMADAAQLDSEEIILAGVSLALSDRATESAWLLLSQNRPGERKNSDIMATAALVGFTCLQMEKHYEKALKMADEANKCEGETNPRYLIILSIALAYNGRSEEAAQMADKALKRLPSAAPIRPEYQRILQMHREKKLYRLNEKSEWALGLLL